MNREAYTAYIDTYLGKVDQIDDSTRAQLGSQYEFIFQYIYPRVYEIRRSQMGDTAGSISPPDEIAKMSTTAPKATPTASGNLILVVNSDILPKISVSVDTFKNDLIREGYRLFVYTDFNANSSPVSVRNKIILENSKTPISGIFLIGKMPSVNFRSQSCVETNPENTTYPSDVFYGDFTSTWATVGEGGFFNRVSDRKAQAWVGRIDYSNINGMGSEEQLLNEYFARNHQYRTSPAQGFAGALDLQ
jgi:hypothetical protein